MSDQTARGIAIPNEDRIWLLMEEAWVNNGCTVLGWADNSVVHAVQDRSQAVNFDVESSPRRTHEDAVLVIALRVPHPDEMSLAELVLGCPCCDLDGTHRHSDECVHPCCPDGDDG